MLRSAITPPIMITGTGIIIASATRDHYLPSDPTCGESASEPAAPPPDCDRAGGSASRHGDSSAAGSRGRNQGSAPGDVDLDRPVSYVLLAPFSDVLDGLTFFSQA